MKRLEDQQPMPTIKDVAKASGVSIATVSYVLNDRPVKAMTRQRVLRAIRDLDYHPNAIARGLQRKRMNALGVIMVRSGKALLTDPYYSPILDGVFDVGLACKQNVTIFNGTNWDEADQEMANYADGRCDGFLLIIPTINTPLIPALQRRGLPFVVVGERGDDPMISSIDIDNRTTARRATEYLLSLGHRRIVHLEGDANLESARERRLGFLDAMTGAGIPDAEALAVPGYYVETSGYERTRDILLPMMPRPTAIFGASDLAALGAMRAVQEAGLRVPEDISLIGINGNTQGETSAPPLTTLSQSLHQLGERATELLISLIEADHPLVRKETQATEFISRASTAYLNVQ